MAEGIIPCEVFVAFQSDGPMVFAKNSHRPQDEVQEIYLAKRSTQGSNLKCTYIEIDNADDTNVVIMSKPGWMWGAEMGSNDKNVVIGVIPLRSQYNEGDADVTVKRLLPMDLVRLGLERGSSAEESLDVIVSLLEKYGQGGPCVESDGNISYHSAFVIVDTKNVWLLETCGKFWAAEKIESSRRFSNQYSIQSNITKMSSGLKERALELQLWDGSGDFNFAKSFAVSGDVSDAAVNKYFEDLSKKPLATSDVFNILRNKELGICHSIDNAYPTQSSQVSCLYESIPSVHWFTGTPDPNTSVYKPFVFTPNVSISQHTICDANKCPHMLYNLHKKKSAAKSQDILIMLQAMEAQCDKEISEFLENFSNGSMALEELDELMKDCVETEVKFYR